MCIFMRAVAGFNIEEISVMNIEEISVMNIEEISVMSKLKLYIFT